MPDAPARVAIRVVDVYPYRRADSGAEMLLLRRAPGRVYAGAWRMVGGKIEPGEAAWQAAARELGEETGCAPMHLWALPSVNVFYEWQADRVSITPAFAAELAPGDEPVLDAEHDAFAWLAPDVAASRLAWPEQQRLARLCARLVAEDAVADGWVIPNERFG